jgi:general secretion pathway protein K
MNSGRVRGFDRGMALVVVLWAISLLSIMAGSFSLSLQRESGLLTASEDRAKALALAEGGVNYAMLMLSLPDPTRRWRGDGTPYRAKLPTGLVHLRIHDESGKIDVNAAQEATLTSLFTRSLNDPDRAAALSDAIMDWRDPDDLKRIHGAESAEYQAAGRGYVPQNRNFQALEEVQMVLGMSPQLFAKLAPVLTIYTGQDGINPAKASREALLALPGLDEKTVDQYLELRRATPPNVPPPALPLPPGGIRLTGGGELAYTILADASMPDGRRFGLQVAVRRQQGRSGAPFAVAAWTPVLGGSQKQPPEHRPEPSADFGH